MPFSTTGFMTLSFYLIQFVCATKTSTSCASALPENSGLSMQDKGDSC